MLGAAKVLRLEENRLAEEVDGCDTLTLSRGECEVREGDREPWFCE